MQVGPGIFELPYKIGTKFLFNDYWIVAVGTCTAQHAVAASFTSTSKQRQCTITVLIHCIATLCVYLCARAAV